MDVRSVINGVNEIIKQALAPSSKTVYSRAWKHFSQCMNTLQIPFKGYDDLPLSVENIMLYIGYLHKKGYAPSTIITNISAISYVHKICDVPDPTQKFFIQKLLCGALKVSPRSDPRLPITDFILDRLMSSLDNTVDNPYLRSLFKAMYTISFFGLMIIGEITANTLVDVKLFLDQVQLFPNHIVLTISNFKHNTSKKPIELVLVKQKNVNICPVFALRNYLYLRGTSSGPLFCLPNFTPITRDLFIRHLKVSLKFCQLNPSLYKSHSFRIGGASYYASIGLSDQQIRLIGRWKSNAFRKYIRCQRLLLALKS